MEQGGSEEILAVLAEEEDQVDDQILPVPVQDIFVCGSCREIYHDLTTFLLHKQNCQVNTINVIEESTIDTQ